MGINLPKEGSILIESYSDSELSDILLKLRMSRKRIDSKNLKHYKFISWNERNYWACKETSKSIYSYQIAPLLNTKDKEQSNPNNNVTSEPEEDTLPNKGAVRISTCSIKELNYIADVLKLHKECSSYFDLKNHSYLVWDTDYYWTSHMSPICIYEKDVVLHWIRHGEMPPSYKNLSSRSSLWESDVALEDINLKPELELKVFNAKKRKRLTQDVAIVSTTQFKLK